MSAEDSTMRTRPAIADTPVCVWSEDEKQDEGLERKVRGGQKDGSVGGGLEGQCLWWPPMCQYTVTTPHSGTVRCTVHCAGAACGRC